jgi:hypothetical protein
MEDQEQQDQQLDHPPQSPIDYSQYSLGVLTFWNPRKRRGAAIDAGIELRDAKIFYRVMSDEITSFGEEYLRKGSLIYFQPKQDRWNHYYAHDIFVVKED